MKLLFLLCLLLFCRPLLNGQGFNDFSFGDQSVLHLPSSETVSTTAIAGYVQSNFKTDREKLHAIYSWVVTNIRYDRDSMYPINWSMDYEEKISATLRRRRGVCENYAFLFSDIALKAGFPSFVVSGYNKQSGSVDNSGHSWCAVYLQREWFLCDPTWDNGNHSTTKYFLVPPAQFIETHMPFDPLWQLLESPLTEYEFRRGGYPAKNRPFFNFADSVKSFLQLDSLQQLEASNRRIRQAGIENDRIKNWAAYNQMKIAAIYGEKDMGLYNLAVADLNKASKVFNDFVQYRNNRFLPSRPDAEINSMLDPIAILLASALKKLDQVGVSAENFQYDTGNLKERLSKLVSRVKEQQIFLKRYLAGNITDRAILFYK